MSRLEWDRRGIAAFLRSPGVGGGCLSVARDQARVIAARTPRDTGETAASTRAERAMFADRAGAYIVQEGAGVQTHFGNARTRAQHHATRGH